MAGLLDFLSREAGRRRTQARDEAIENTLSWLFGPTGIPERLNAIAMLNPVQDIYEAGANARDGDYTGAAVNTASALMPIAGAKLAGGGLADDAANVISDTLTNVGVKAQGAMNAGQAFAADEFGGISVFHGGSGDVRKAASDKGAWFSETQDLADEYAFGGGSVRSAEIEPARPIEFRHAEQRRPIGDLVSTALDGAGDLSDDVIGRVSPIVDRLNARYGNESRPLFEYWNNDPDVAALFRALGYDSISVAEKSGGAKTWAALDPAIIQ